MQLTSVAGDTKELLRSSFIRLRPRLPLSAIAKKGLGNPLEINFKESVAGGASVQDRLGVCRHMHENGLDDDKLD